MSDVTTRGPHLAVAVGSQCRSSNTCANRRLRGMTDRSKRFPLIGDGFVGSELARALAKFA